jgi:hypothetical protein
MATFASTEPLTQDELATLQHDLHRTAAVAEIIDVEGTRTILLTLSGAKPLDLSLLPAAKNTHIAIQVVGRATTVTLKDLSPESIVTVSILNLEANRAITDLRLHDCRGQVRLLRTVTGTKLFCESSRDDGAEVQPGGEAQPVAEARPAGMTQPEEAQAAEQAAGQAQPTESPSVVLLKDVELTIEESLHGTTLILDGGKVWVGADIDDVMVASTGRLDVIDNYSSNLVRNLAVVGDATVELGPDVPRFETIAGLAPSPQATMTVRIMLRKGASGDPVTVDHMKDVVVSAPFAPVKFERVKTVTNAEIRGGTRLNLRQHATVAQTRFVPIDGSTDKINPVLTSAEGSFLLDVSGTVDIGEAPGIHIAAGAKGLAVNLAADVSSQDPWKGAMMTDIMLPTGLVGRRMLDRLDSAYQFTPAVDGLPGRDQTLLARVFRKRRIHYRDDPAMQRQLYEDAEFMRELAALCRKKGTPGSVSTTVSWCAYRLRHLKSRGVEKAALTAYRWLGYGERPLPAFILWAVLSLALAGPVLAAGGAHYHPSGLGAFFSEVGRLALGPLAGLLRGGTLSGGDLAEIAARALISIPLVTGALALRNYVKSER